MDHSEKQSINLSKKCIIRVWFLCYEKMKDATTNRLAYWMYIWMNIEQSGKYAYDDSCHPTIKYYYILFMFWLNFYPSVSVQFIESDLLLYIHIQFMFHIKKNFSHISLQISLNCDDKWRKRNPWRAFFICELFHNTEEVYAL